MKNINKTKTITKKILALLLGGALIASLGACGKEEQEPVEMLAQGTELADYSSCVTLGQYTGMDIPVSGADVTQEQLEARKRQEVEMYNYLYAEAEKITNRTVALGDTINMDFTTTMDGENMELLSGADLAYGVGSGQIEESLDGRMAGLSTGQTYDLECTFGADTDFEELAGKTVTFHVTINYIYGEAATLGWGDELANAASGGKYAKAEDYEDYLYGQMQEKAQEQQQQEYMDGIWEAVLAGCTFTGLPEDVIKENAESYYASQKSLFEYYATYYSSTYEAYLKEKQGMTDEEFHEKAYEYARTELERIYVAVTIFRERGMELSDEAFSRGVAELAERYGYDSSAEFVETYGEEYVREVLVAGSVEEYLRANNNMVVKEQVE